MKEENKTINIALELDEKRNVRANKGMQVRRQISSDIFFSISGMPFFKRFIRKRQKRDKRSNMPQEKTMITSTRDELRYSGKR